MNDFAKLKVKPADIRTKWVALCLDGSAFDNLLEVSKLDDKQEIEWKKLLGVICGSIGKVRGHV